MGLINGFPTHNSFNSLAPAFTVFEIYSVNGQAVSAGIRDATITETEITVPEPASADSSSKSPRSG